MSGTESLKRSSIGASSQRLSIDGVLGSSVKNPNHFDIQGNVMAYTASGGVVVCRLSSDNKISSQRFFCANGNTNSSPYNSTNSSATAYLDMMYNEANLTNITSPVKKDKYGFPIRHEPMNIFGNERTGSLSKGGSNERSSDGSDSQLSPSKLRDKVRSITCLAISPNQKLLAVGESGYQPRILIFSLAPDSSDSALALIYEHSFGINSIRFSPDSKFFCSLGAVNDGFLNVWKSGTGSFQLHSSNKCSSKVNQVIWHKNLIVTIGLRMLKVWKHEPDICSQKTELLRGKNVVLGPFIDSNFINIDVINSEEMILMTSDHQLVLLKLDYNQLKIFPLEGPGFDFESLLVDHDNEKVWFGTEASELTAIALEELKPSPNNVVYKIEEGEKSPMRHQIPESYARIYNFNSNYILSLTKQQEIRLTDKTEKTSTNIVAPLVDDLAGTKLCSSGDLMIFSKDGHVKKFISDKNSFRTVINFELTNHDFISNSLTSIDYFDGNLILGDKYGQVYIIDNKSQTILYDTKAHSSTVNDIVSFKVANIDFVVTVSRDRMIQIFHKTENKWEILQTIPLHNGNVSKVKYFDQRIYAISSDRTVSIHEIRNEDSAVQIFQEKIIALKSAPIYLDIYENDLVVSTNDKSILVYGIDSGYELKRSFKLLNDRTNENILVDNFAIRKNSFITSATDKSIRIFNYSNKSLIHAAGGHSDLILTLCHLSSGQFATISFDGCLFKWNFIESDISNLKFSFEPEVVDEPVPIYSKVTRKILPSSPPKPSTTKRSSYSECQESPSNKSGEISTPPHLTSATLKRLEAKKLSLQSPKKQSPLSKSPSKGGPKTPTSSPTRVGSKKQPVHPLKMQSISPQKSLSKSFNNHMENLSSLEEFIKSSQINDYERERFVERLKEILDLVSTHDINDGLESLRISNPPNVQEKRETEQELINRFGNKLVSLVEQKLENRVFQPLSLNSSRMFPNGYKEQKMSNFNDVD